MTTRGPKRPVAIGPFDPLGLVTWAIALAVVIQKPLNAFVLITATVVTIVGALDAIASSEWDFFAVFALTASLQLMLLTQLRARRPSVQMRSDLVSWLRNQSALTGEPIEKISDRAVAAYRAGLSSTRLGGQP